MSRARAVADRLIPASSTLTEPRVDYGIVRGLEEDVNVVASAATGTINLDTLTASIWFYTSNASANHTLNIRGNSSNTLNSILDTGDSLTVVWANTNGTTIMDNKWHSVDTAR